MVIIIRFMALEILSDYYYYYYTLGLLTNANVIRKFGIRLQSFNFQRIRIRMRSINIV